MNMQMNKSKSKVKRILIVALGAVCLVGGVAAFILFKQSRQEKPEDLLKTYMNHISKQEYEEMYQMIMPEKSGNISREDFIARNSKIYEGIEMQDMKIENLRVEEEENGKVRVAYQTAFDTVAGEIQFDNQADFIKGEDGYELIWKDNLIHPELHKDDKVQVITSQAKRGYILDRNGVILAGEGVASSVGIVPGKLKDKKSAFKKLEAILGTDAASIEEKLDAGWVKEDSFVPIKTIPKVQEVDLLKLIPDEDAMKEKEQQDRLLKIPGVMITDVEVRQYPMGNAAAHLIGYVQGVTAEDLEEHAGEGYTANSVIGRSGMEGLFEKELKGQNGCEIYISDAQGNKKAVLASIAKKNGQDVKLTIDKEVQELLYEQFQEDKSCTVAMNPYTGEVLALISTPSYDDNDFIMGMSTEEWTSLNEDENKPMYNRFRQVWCPGSVLKPIIGAIGLKTGAINPDEDYGNVGLSWQKDSTWGSYYVTTLHAYEPVILENALIYSDNIYFAKSALKIGAEDLAQSLEQLGFDGEMPFEIIMEESQYSNTDTFESEVQLADSGYGQAQMLVNPVHLASLYTAFANGGDVIKPYLRFKEEPEKEVWISDAFPEGAAGQILEGMKKVVNDPNGTGYSAHREDIQLAGKTGTAEIKASAEDTSGTELGWFAVLTAEENEETPILVVSMVEDVKERGGSGYVVDKVKNMLDMYFVQ